MEFFEHVWSIIKTIQFRDIIDILAIALIIFGLFRLLRDTRAIQLLKGIAFLFIVYFLSSLLELVMLSTLLRAFFEAAVVVIVVIFQPEIRKALEQMGRNKTWTKRFVFLFKSLGKSDEWKDAVRKSITDAADTSVLFSRSKTGALIVFERETMLSDIAATGTIVNADTSVALFGNIFFNKAPLHDGASIIRDGKLYAAGCILPLTDDKTVDMNLGTRHRAALGISEQSDSVVLVVSEETGVISLACNGTLTRDYTRETLVCKLSELLLDEFEDENPKKNRKFMRGRKKD
ncbi:MAG: diadenylate cyclase CdaA [Ruminococcus sp.]|nr:diadenylate cyclase CdaA [uncultured Ruminococcus sp.]MBQ1349611.1 diadenylate cyclase CdaA [Ruminococcus sp.]SCX01492.1 diadenylate cyclase [Ruminococcaceae bacterium P7]MBQ2469716.1 diadenylate cyclase CdaA [Ruminococcus sp.]MBQ4170508.1 diadenylate cyclase CdaA [Ruminococcus sp.]MBQ4260976.1 diadenylate cyclase CdaA [Ruminococcus sp.]